jgi:ATP-dependent DNA helicase RecQ
LLARKVLSGIARGGERWGRRKIAAMLVGKVEDLPDALTSLSTTGILSDHDPRLLEKWMDALEGAGALRSSPDIYRTLRLTPLGRDVMAGRTTELNLLVPSVTIKAPKGKRRERGSKTVPGSPADAADAQLVDALRNWRREEAAERAVPAYVVLHDKTIQALASAKPQTREALLDVPGLGPTKVERYGEALLTVINPQ